jgi:hypothetical protein
MRARIFQLLRLLLFFLAACSGLLVIFLALTAIPEAGRNPASPEFGWLRSDWLEGFVLATALIGLAIRIAAGRTRVLFACLLLITWVASTVPGYQFLAYQLVPDFKRLIANH